MFRKLLAFLLVFVGAFAMAACQPTTDDLTDLEKLAEALEDLAISTEVSSDLTLPTTGLHDVTVTWTSSNTDVITNAGVVTRPLLTEGNETVTMTAVISLGNQQMQKTFTVTVLAATTKTDAEKVEEALAALYLVEGIIVSDLSLQSEVVRDDFTATVTWASTNTDAIALDGTVTRPENGEGNAAVTLTATITIGSVSDTRDFEFSVKEKDLTNISDSVADLHDGAILGDILEFTGIVSAIFDGGYFLTDGTNAIGIYNPGGLEDGEVALGDEVHVIGSYAQYNSLYQIGSVTTEEL